MNFENKPTNRSRTPLHSLFGWSVLIHTLLLNFACADPIKIVAFGDSTTARRGKTEIYVNLLQERLGPEKVTILNKGVPRHTTRMAARRFERDVIEPAPDIVIIQFGINDSVVDVWADPPKTKPRNTMEAYEADLRNFVRESKATGAGVILMTPNQLRWTPYLQERYGKPPYNPADERGFNLYLRDYAGVVRKVAAEEGAGLVDVFAAYDDFEKSTGKSASELLLDGMHPNSDGHRLVADLLEPLVKAEMGKRASAPQVPQANPERPENPGDSPD